MITATISRTGMLIIQPSNELEQYALGKWSEDKSMSDILIKAPEQEKYCGSNSAGPGVVTKR